jgi:hypothetical protein
MPTAQADGACWTAPHAQREVRPRGARGGPRAAKRAHREDLKSLGCGAWVQHADAEAANARRELRCSVLYCAASMVYGGEACPDAEAAAARCQLCLCHERGCGLVRELRRVMPCTAAAQHASTTAYQPRLGPSREMYPSISAQCGPVRSATLSRARRTDRYSKASLRARRAARALDTESRAFACLRGARAALLAKYYAGSRRQNGMGPEASASTWFALSYGSHCIFFGCAKR